MSRSGVGRSVVMRQTFVLVDVGQPYVRELVSQTVEGAPGFRVSIADQRRVRIGLVANGDPQTMDHPSKLLVAVVSAAVPRCGELLQSTKQGVQLEQDRQLGGDRPYSKGLRGDEIGAHVWLREHAIREEHHDRAEKVSGGDVERGDVHEVTVRVDRADQPAG